MGKQRIELKTKQRIAVSPEVIRMLGGDPASAVYYRQLQYYDQYAAKNIDGWFAKNTVEMEAATGMNRRRQDTCRENLVRLGLIEIRTSRGGRKPTCFFRVLVDYR